MNFKKEEINKMINKIRMERNHLTWDDVDRYTTKEEKAKALETGVPMYVPAAIISLRKEQEMLGYGIGKLNRYEHDCLQLARKSPYPRTRQLNWEMYRAEEMIKLAAASA
mgnify:CR=1 FL=1